MYNEILVLSRDFFKLAQLSEQEDIEEQVGDYEAQENVFETHPQIDYKKNLWHEKYSNILRERLSQDPKIRQKLDLDLILG